MSDAISLVISGSWLSSFLGTNTWVVSSSGGYLGDHLYGGYCYFVKLRFGLPLGVVLVTTDRGHILENQAVNKILGGIVNAVRSIPLSFSSSS